MGDVKSIVGENMANTMRWRYGETNPLLVPTNDKEDVEIGDILIFENSMATPVTSICGKNSDELTLLLHRQFLGVAMQSSKFGDGERIRIATSGVFEFDCLSQYFDIGDLLGGLYNPQTNVFYNQTVNRVTEITSSIGRCCKQVNPAANKVLVEIVSSIMRGGPQAIA